MTGMLRIILLKQHDTAAPVSMVGLHCLTMNSLSVLTLYRSKLMLVCLQMMVIMLHCVQLPHMTPHYNFLRKPPADFGWDWGPNFTPAGIYGEVQLLASSFAYLSGAVLCCAALCCAVPCYHVLPHIPCVYVCAVPLAHHTGAVIALVSCTFTCLHAECASLFSLPT